jgi:SprT protein
MKKELEIFQKYFPAETVTYCFDLWQRYKFHFKILPPRQTKLGDYQHDPRRGHIVTVNGDLNPFAFLVTYIHEVAHLQVFAQYAYSQEPHGLAWKKQFRETFAPLLEAHILPIELEKALRNYLQNPAAATYRDKNLSAVLRTFDTKVENIFNQITLGEVPINTVFQFKKRIFVKQETRRTRVLCEETSTKKRYLISSEAVVEIVN